MNKKSLFHISKRDTLPWYTNVAIRGGAIILALVGNGQFRLRMGDEQRNRDQKHHRAREERRLVFDGRGRLRAGDGAAVGLLGALEFLAEAEHKINEDQHKADRHDHAGIFDKVEECVAERGAEDDVRRVAAHRRRAAQICAEDL